MPSNGECGCSWDEMKTKMKNIATIKLLRGMRPKLHFGRISKAPPPPPFQTERPIERPTDRPKKAKVPNAGATTSKPIINFA